MGKLPAGILADFIDLLDQVEKYGPNLGEPHTKSMRRGFYELRANGLEGIARGLFCSVKGNQIVILHVFQKKLKKPQEES
ncbi:type II toxin-antitoxin system RelE/ParE family toxin [Endozoicomonas ascidiicola]|uniref:type II toxin-antitoxin system RelE/ParE family toxin n=1 Tax=Endozoicomonas ascidiicola TaxID=1698521 RepID=UPI000BA4C126|nr:type II toxin-antitoxin system RelE/ParE family toxin [Endozoicomonas ascidiicola]